MSEKKSLRNINFMPYSEYTGKSSLNEDELYMVPLPMVIVEFYHDGINWYKLYSNGWCEQGGKAQAPSTGEGIATLLKTFKDTNYTISVALEDIGSTTKREDPITVYSVTTTSFKMGIKASASCYCNWVAQGFISQ